MGRREGRMTVDLAELSRLELEVMDIVWGLGECTSAQVIEAFSKKRKLAPTTIRTVLANLRKKGYLEPIPTIERGFRLRAIVARDAVVRRTLPNLVRHLFGGSPRHAIAWLLKSESISDAELAEIRQLLEAKKRGGKS